MTRRPPEHLQIPPRWPDGGERAGEHLYDPVTYERALRRIVAQFPHDADRAAVRKHYLSAVVELTLDGSITVDQAADLGAMIERVLDVLPDTP